MKGSVAIVAVLLLAALAWLAFSGSSGAVEQTPRAAGRSDAAAASAPEAGPVGDGLDGAATPNRPPARQEVAGEEHQPGEPASAVTVQVVDRASGEPVAGAEVLYPESAPHWNELDPDAQRAAQRLMLDLERYLRQAGARALTDEDGHARVVLVEPWTRIAARKDARYGELQLGATSTPPAGGWRLELEPDLGFQVEVVDAAGEPVADMPVRATYARFESWTQELGRGSTIVGLSDEAGIVAVRHAQRWGAFEADGVRTVALDVPLVGARAAAVELDLNRLPDEPVRLVCPPSGFVRVSAVDMFGAPIEEFWPNLMLASEARPGMSGGQWLQRRLDGGVVEFLNVALGHDYRVTVWVGGQTLTDQLSGPIRPGDVVDVVLRQSADSVALVGRAVTDAGEPIAERQLSIQLTAKSGRRWATAKTEVDGRFVATAGTTTRAVERLSFHAFGPDDPGNGLVAVVEFGGAELSPGRNDLGDVVFDANPLLVAGRVVERAADGDAGPARVNLIVERLHVQTRNGESVERWARTGFSAWSSADGTFRVLGRAPGGRLRLRAWSQQHLAAAPVELVAGDEDLALELVRGGAMRARIVHDRLLRVRWMRLDLVPRGGDALAGPAEAALGVPGQPRPLRGQAGKADEESCEFHWQGLTPGTYDLEVRPAGAERPVVVVSGIEVRGGAASDDPRLDPIDLRGQLRRIAIRVVDPAGQPIADGGAVVLARCADPDADLEGARLTGGEAVFLTAEPQLDVVVAATGYPVEERYRVQGDVTVTLRHGPRLRVSVDGPGDLPDGVSLRIWLRPEKRATPGGPRYRLIRYQLVPGRGGRIADLLGQPAESIVPDARGEAVVALREPGEYRFSAQLRRQSPGGVATIAGIAPAEIEVEGGAAEQLVRLSIPRANVEQALAKLRETR